MMQEKRIEPAVVVKDHNGMSGVAMEAPFALAMAEWREGIRQGKGITLLMNSLYTLDGDIDLNPRVKRVS